MKLILPDIIFDRLEDVSVEYLKGAGIKGVILDLDNTLVPPHTPRPTERALAWISNCEKGGISLFLVSNNKRTRVETFCEGTPLLHSHRSAKPLPFFITRARKIMGLKKSECALLGDQLLTDVMGARLAGIRSLLVRPETAEPGWFFRLKRKFERFVLNRYGK